MVKPDPHCPICRGLGRHAAPDYSHASWPPEIRGVKCQCVSEQQAFKNIVLDLFILVALLAACKLIFS